MFELSFEVRDYECDMQGIVNNSNYLHYLEHTRHCYLKSIGLDFAQLITEDIYLVIAKMELTYQQPLRPNMKFQSSLKVAECSRAKVVFTQLLYASEHSYLKAGVTAVVTDKAGKLLRLPEHIKDKLV